LIFFVVGLHFWHSDFRPVPALMMTWPRPRQCLQVFEVFMVSEIYVGIDMIVGARWK
jgi:hypothetical protein